MPHPLGPTRASVCPGFTEKEPLLLDATIAENIRYGALFREVSDAEVIEAAN